MQRRSQPLAVRLPHRGAAAASILGFACCWLGLAAQEATAFSLQRTFYGEVVGDQFGYCVAGAGDVDGDGYADVLVGANVNDEAALSGGKVYLYLGGPDYPTTPYLTYAGALERGYLGAALAGGRDIDGDGLDDFLVGAPGPGADGTHPGRVYVFLGGSPPGAPPHLVLEGVVPGGQFGAAVALGDLNGNGHADLIVGAPRAGDGQVAIFRGGPLPLGVSPVQVIHARAQDQRFGTALLVVPDQDGDGCDELLVGIPRSSEAAVWAGAVALYRGGAELDTVPDLVLLGEAAGDEFGASLAAGGDLDGDGHGPDVVVGAPAANSGSLVDAGSLYIFGGGDAWDAVPELTVRGGTASARLGQAVAGGFDWNDDGAGDLAAGSPQATANDLLYAGRCDIIFGGAVLDALIDETILGDEAHVHLATSLASVGPVIGLARGALAIGGYNSGNPGRVLLYGPDAEPTDVPWTAPAAARLEPPFPNPFNPRVALAFELPVDQAGGAWRFTVHDLKGRLVSVLHDGPLNAGRHEFRWQGLSPTGEAVPSGIYLFRGVGPAGSLVQKGALLR
jgi:hypothetical protein